LDFMDVGEDVTDIIQGVDQGLWQDGILSGEINTYDARTVK